MKPLPLLILCISLFCGFSHAEEIRNEKPDRGRFPEKMTVKVVDEAGKPVLNASGYHRFGKYVNFNVDENGEFEIPMPQEKEGGRIPACDFTIHAEGYGPFSAMFSSDPIIPETFTVVLKPAQKIGGIVVDENGNPLEDVEVELMIHFATQYKTSENMVTMVDVKTDAQGKWSLFHLPASFSATPGLTLRKDGYRPTYVTDVPAVKLNPDREGNYHERLTIEKGYRFSGKIVDETGSPIKDASLQKAGYFRSDDPVLTDENGEFAVENCELDDCVFYTLWASGKASQVFRTEIRSEEKPLEIVMTPGRNVTFEVVDSAGKPIPEATIGINHINDQPGGHYGLRSEFLKSGNKTDENGRVLWSEAPGVPFEFRCGADDFGSTTAVVEPDQDTVRVTLYRSKITLNILDDESGEPIPSFHVVTRYFTNAEDDNFRSWSQPEPGSGGTMETRLYGGDSKAVRFDVEAPSYEKRNSRKVKYGEENVELEIRLVKSTQAAEPTVSVTQKEENSERLFPLSGGKVLTPEGKPAANAQVSVAVAITLCGGSAEPVLTDAEGEFLLSEAQLQMIGPQKYTLKITHASGVAVIDGDAFREKHEIHNSENAQPISLQPWARIEGTLKLGTKTLEGTSVALRWSKPDSLAAHPGFYDGTKTKKDGRFVFSQVMPGIVTISRMEMTNFGSGWSTYCATLEVKPGETLTCALGGTGRTVQGKAVAPGKVDYRKYTARVVPKPENLEDLIAPELPKEYWPDRENRDPNVCDLRIFNYFQTPEGKEYKERSERNSKAMDVLHFRVLQENGTFRFEDLPDGDYALVISESVNCGLGFSEGPYHYRGFFTVKEPHHSTPLDLGERPLIPAEK